MHERGPYSMRRCRLSGRHSREAVSSSLSASRIWERFSNGKARVRTRACFSRRRWPSAGRLFPRAIQPSSRASTTWLYSLRTRENMPRRGRCLKRHWAFAGQHIRPNIHSSPRASTVWHSFMSVRAYTPRLPLAILRAALPANHPNIAGQIDSMSFLHLNHGEYARAQPLFEEVLAISRATLPPGHPDIATDLQSLVRLQLLLGHRAQALRCMRRPWPLCEPSLSLDIRKSRSVLSNWRRYGRACARPHLSDRGGERWP